MFRPSYACAAHLMAMALNIMSLARTAEHHFYGRSSVHKKDHTRVRGRSYPQHGARECARRVRQMEKAAAHGSR